MRIAIFTDCYSPIKNGVVTSIMQLKGALEVKGHHVLVLTTRVRGFDERETNVIRFPSFPIGLGTELVCGLVSQRQVNRLIESHDIELVHTHTEFNLGLSGKLAAKRFDLPHVHTTHTMWEEYRHYVLKGMVLNRGLVRGLLRLYLRNSYALVSPSMKARNYYQALVPDVPIAVIPNGIEMEKFNSGRMPLESKANIRKRWGIGASDKVMLFVGRLGREKRVGELLDAVVPVLAAEPSARMMFVGDGPERSKLQETARSLRLDDRFVFTGYVHWRSVRELYAISDLFVTASVSEVHSMTMIEAMMSALAIVAREDESYRNSVRNDVNGYLAASDAELTEKLIEVVGNESKLAGYGEASARLAKSFSAEKHADGMEKFYESVLARYPDPLDSVEGCVSCP